MEVDLLYSATQNYQALILFGSFLRLQFDLDADIGTDQGGAGGLESLLTTVYAG